MTDGGAGIAYSSQLIGKRYMNWLVFGFLMIKYGMIVFVGGK